MPMLDAGPTASAAARGRLFPIDVLALDSRNRLGYISIVVEI
jgi:hypothetical protein